MAKKTNKTDHVLNLLSSGKKTNAKEENDAPPVDLRRRAPEPPEEDILPGVEDLPEPRMTEQEDHDLPEPKITRTVEEELPEPAAETQAVVTAEPVPETKVTVEMAPKAPGVSVVHTANEESHIAEAVKDSLEAEFNEYLREKGEIPAEPETERLIEWELPKTKEPTEINVFELMRESEEEDEAQQEEAEVPAEPTAEAEPEEVTPAPIEPEPELEAEAPVEAAPAVSEPEPERSEEGPAVSELKPEAPARVEPEQAPEQEPAAPVEAVPAVLEQEPEPAAPAEAAPAVSEPEPEEEPMEEKDYTMVNVMEYLVRDQAPKYIRQFGHCDCDRCIEDTVALTLTHLPAKYVVVNKNAVSPLLNFYEKRYAGQLIVEITKATMIVNESPNH